MHYVYVRYVSRANNQTVKNSFHRRMVIGHFKHLNSVFIITNLRNACMLHFYAPFGIYFGFLCYT